MIAINSSDPLTGLPVQCTENYSLRKATCPNGKEVQVFVLYVKGSIGLSPLGESDSKKKAKEALIAVAGENPALASLLRSYGDVFPDDLPDGLPSKRTVEMKVDLKPGTETVKRPMYELSAEELGEAKKQLDGLLWKGFSRPSTSPWRTSLLGLPKKD